MALIRLYTVQMGTFGQKPDYKSKPMPIYLALRKAMNASPELTNYFKHLRAGQYVFGHLVKLDDDKFIAIVEQGRTYHTAGQSPTSKERVGYLPPRSPDQIPVSERGETFRNQRRTAVPTSTRRSKRQSEAERIAARMAASARNAAEGAPKEES